MDKPKLNKMKSKKLLLIGSNSIHLYNYHCLVQDYFSEIMVITNKKRYDYSNKSIFYNYFGYWNIFKLYKTILFIRKKIKEFKPNIIHVHQINSYSFITVLACRKMNIPIVLTAWGDDILVDPQKSLILKKIVLFCLRKATAITSDSLYMTYKIKELLNFQDIRIDTINFGIEMPNFFNHKEKIIYSNRLHQDFYRIDKIMLAFNRFYKNNKDWRLIVAGEGSETEKLKQLLFTLECKEAVEIVGWVNKDVNQEYYSKSKIFVSIPTTDATAVSLLEAMSNGCVPVVSNLPANLEWVMNGVNGLIVNNVNIDFLQQAIILDQEEMANHNRLIINKRALKKNSIKMFSDLYDSLM